MGDPTSPEGGLGRPVGWAAVDVMAEIVLPAVEEARATIASCAKLGLRADSPLFADGGLDSMGLVQLIVLVEERIDDRLGLQVRLASDKALSRRSSPFATLGALARFIDECLDEARGS